MRRICGAGVELAVVDEGEGQSVLLLHGFPDSSQGWRYQVRALTKAGFRALAPDLRGFGESGKPAAVEEYRVSRSVADMVCVLDELHVERVHVVGHDWGGAVAWALAALHPGRVDRLVVLSVGHPAEYREPSLEQRRRFWYQLLFQFTGVAEQLLEQNDWKLLRDWIADAVDRDRFIADLSRPGALAPALNWYRANGHPRRTLERRPSYPSVSAPTLALWSDGDPYLTEEPVLASANHVTCSWRYERIEGAGHWLQVDAHERVNALLIEFLTSAPPSELAVRVTET